MKNDEFGARMKAYEAVETKRRLNPQLPIYARIDGRSFSKFTRGMNRPFDRGMSEAMQETTKYLVEETHALMGYVQSDEISLVWQAPHEEADIFFSGKVQKMCSVMASMASAKFMTVINPVYRVRLPHFDCRVFQLPTKEEAANAFLWRAMDARKNAISMVAHSRFSPKLLHGKSQKDMLNMLAGEGIDFAERFPWHFRHGVFFRRFTEERALSEEEMANIPEKHRPTGLVIRSEVRAVNMPPFNEVKNRVEVIFDGADPVSTWEVICDQRQGGV